MAVLILLPPSEGKTAPTSGAPVELADLSHPELTAVRARVGKALVAASSRRDALAMLGVGPSLAPQVAGNTTLWSNPTAPAAHVYTGVLYDAAGSATWSADELVRAHDRVRIISGLWGAVSPADLIPPYRLNMCVALPRVGPLTALWRASLAKSLDPIAAEQLIVDCRSSDYATVWKPPPGALAVRVAYEQGGKRKIASHTAKYTRGLLTGALVRAPKAPESAEALAELAAELPTVAAVELGESSITLVTA
jgi:cytoplasmic iron level regulating protein YaaA (DUF328/UPF0246 family)